MDEVSKQLMWLISDNNNYICRCPQYCCGGERPTAYIDYIPEWFFVFLLISTQAKQEELTSEKVWCGRVQ
jgi:hypothetical protein